MDLPVRRMVSQITQALFRKLKAAEFIPLRATLEIVVELTHILSDITKSLGMEFRPIKAKVPPLFGMALNTYRIIKAFPEDHFQLDEAL